MREIVCERERAREGRDSPVRDAREKETERESERDAIHRLDTAYAAYIIARWSDTMPHGGDYPPA